MRINYVNSSLELQVIGIKADNVGMKGIFFNEYYRGI